VIAGLLSYLAKKPKYLFDKYAIVIVLTSLVCCLIGYFFVEVWPIDLVAKSQLFRMTIFVKFFSFLYIAYQIVSVLKKSKYVCKFEGINVSRVTKVSLPVLLMVFLMSLLSVDLKPQEPNSAEKWIKEHTDKDSTFLTPIHYSFGNFALNAERGVVVDLKRFPFTGNSYIEWYERISDVLGCRSDLNIGDIKKLRNADKLKLYHDKDFADIRALTMKYDFNYVVRLQPFYLDEISPIYEDGKYIIYKLN
jgi:hypothetical protein